MALLVSWTAGAVEVSLGPGRRALARERPELVGALLYGPDRRLAAGAISALSGSLSGPVEHLVLNRDIRQVTSTRPRKRRSVERFVGFHEDPLMLQGRLKKSSFL